MVTTQSSPIKVQYRPTFWQFAKWKSGIITINPTGHTLQITDATSNVVVFSSPIKDILYQFAGRNFIIMSQRKRMYLGFYTDTSPTTPEAAAIGIGAVGAAAGLAGSGTVAAGQQSQQISKQQLEIKQSSGYQQLEAAFTQMGAKVSRKPGKPATRTTYATILLIANLILVSRYNDPVYLIGGIVVSLFVIVSFEVS